MLYFGDISLFFIIFSVFIAIITCYTTLVLVERILDGRRAKKITWLFIGALIMGTGFFSAHFIGKIAFHITNPMSYHGALLLLAFICSLIASFTAFYVLQLQPLSKWKIIFSGITIGIGILLLHYVSTIAMHDSVKIQFQSIFFILSIFISLGFSYLAIYMFTRMRNNPYKPFVNNVVNAVLLGLAVSAIHYTEIKATIYNNPDNSSIGINPVILGNLVAAGTIFIMVATLISAYIDHKSIAIQKRLLRRIEESELRYRSLVEQSPEPIIIHSNDIIQFANQAGLNLVYASNKEEVVGKSIFHFIHPDHKEALKKHIQRLRDEGKVDFISDHQIVALNGAILDVEVAWNGIIYKNEPAIQLVMRDLTEQSKMRRELAERKQRYKSLFEYNPDPVYSLNPQGILTELNPAGWEMLGYSTNQLIGSSYHEVVDPQYLEVADASFVEALNGKPQFYEIAIINKAGNRIPVSITNIPIVVDNQVTGVFGMAKDLTKEKEALKKIEELAYTDVLTGLPNRTWLYKYLKELSQSIKNPDSSIAILMIDFDNFKHINDTLGHLFGNLFLQQVSKRIQEVVHDEGKIARLGGDEFIIVLENTTRQDASNLAKRILAIVNSSVNLQGHEITITLSIGISIQSSSSVDIDSIIKEADLALYLAKEKGKNNIQFFTKELNEKITRKVNLENGLRRAIEKQELKLYYQSLVHLQRMEVVGLEALLRWNPSFGFVAPDEFIPIAEETGLIVPIGEWVFREVCKQIEEWKKKNYPIVPISINVSARQFDESDFTRNIKQIIHDAEIDPSLIEMEITESVMLDVQHSAKSIQELRDFGFKIAIDDFGTGYSSLHVIANLEFDTLKIDKSLIDYEQHNDNKKRILKAILEASRNHKRIVVEGIETKEQVDIVKTYNVIGQGYYFSKPLPPEQLPIRGLSP